jgi:O-antigen ligase
MTIRAAPSLSEDVDRGRALDVPQFLFLLTALVAPLSLRVFRALSAYDVLTFVLAIVLVASGHRVQRLPASLWLAALLLFAASLASSFRALYPVESVLHLSLYVFVFVIQLPVIMTVVTSRRLVHAAVAFSIIGYLLVIAVAMVSQRVQLAGRAVPFFNDNANALAIPTIMFAPFILYFAPRLWQKGRTVESVLVAAALYPMLWALTASASRGATAATILSLTIYVVFGVGKGRSRRAILSFAVLALVLVSVGAAVYSTSLFPNTLRDRLEGTINPGESRGVADGRIALGQAGIKAFLESPLVGTGLDNFRYVAQLYDDDATFHDPHNLVIQLLAQTGIVGAAAFAFIIYRWFAMLYRTQALATTVLDRRLLWAFLAAMGGIFAHSMISPLVVQRHYWLLYGLGMAAALGIAREAVATSEPGMGPTLLDEEDPG